MLTLKILILLVIALPAPLLLLDLWLDTRKRQALVREVLADPSCVLRAWVDGPDEDYDYHLCIQTKDAAVRNISYQLDLNELLDEFRDAGIFIENAPPEVRFVV